MYVCASVGWAYTCGCVCGCDYGCGCGCASTRGRKGERNLKVETPEGSHQILPLGNEKCKKSNSYFKLFLSLATHSLTYTSTLSHTHTSILKPTFVCPSHTHSTNGSSSFAHTHSITFSFTFEGSHFLSLSFSVTHSFSPRNDLSISFFPSPSLSLSTSLILCNFLD